MAEYDDLLGRGEYRELSRDELAARVQALTAERDELRGALNDQCDWGNAVADRDAARAELAAANTRIAELEREVASANLAGARGRMQRDEAQATNAALSARLERVRALAEQWWEQYDGTEPPEHVNLGWAANQVRAALGEDA